MADGAWIAPERETTGRSAAIALALALATFPPCACLAAAPHGGAGVIPLPAKVERAGGFFDIAANTGILVPAGDAGAADAAHYLVDLLKRSGGPVLRVATADRPAPGAKSPARAIAASTIAFGRVDGLAREAYELDVAPAGIAVRATTAAGLFYGAVTLWQLLPPGHGQGRIAAQSIRDRPAYRWRGLMLDSVRHFQSPSFIEQMIDWMALHKLNVLHWHLTDDQGWRLEIPRYPRLTSVGAWRVPAAIPGVSSRGEADARYGGYYTEDDVRRIVAHAALRHVLIVPEIEMPGHAQAAIAAYPALGAWSGPPLAVSSSWGVHSHLFNIEPATFRFLEDVLDEVMALFPSPFIHVGGDEAVKDEWNKSAAVQARAHALGIRDGDALQAYFTQRIGRYLAAHGRRMIGWDEILRPGLAKDAVVMSWHGTSGAHAAALAGYDTILAPSPTLYFDNRQSALPNEPPGRLTVVSLADVYHFEPLDPSLTEHQQQHVLGVQANLWTEHVDSGEQAQWMSWPRLAAVAELAWTAPGRRHWDDFLDRLVPMLARYRALGISYADSAFGVEARIQHLSTRVSVNLVNQAHFGQIRYESSGGEPTAASPAFRAPLSLPLNTHFAAATFAGATRISAILKLRLDANSLSRKDSHDLQLCSEAIGLLVRPRSGGDGGGTPIAIDIMNPCWIDRGVDLSNGPRFTAAVAPLPFNYEIGAQAAEIRVGDARTGAGELEVHIDGCDHAAALRLPLAPAAHTARVTRLPTRRLPRIAGIHDLCLRFARPRLDPMWGLDWIQIGD